jgi:hypothetical protein
MTIKVEAEKEGKCDEIRNLQAVMNREYTQTQTGRAV